MKPIWVAANWASASAGPGNLTVERLDGWEQQVTDYLAKGGRRGQLGGLGDEGVDAGTAPDPTHLTFYASDFSQVFVKFLGRGSDRVPLSEPTIEVIKSAGCHWAVSYPAKKRPRSVKDGARIFIARLTRNPNDIVVFGRAIGLAYVSGRDDATPGDIVLRPWKEQWSRYVRVHHAEFFTGTMANGISLYELMDVLKENSFASTQRHAKNSEGNINPRHAYGRQAAVELSSQGFAWLNERLDAAFNAHGNVPANDLARLDWPEIP